MRNLWPLLASTFLFPTCVSGAQLVSEFSPNYYAQSLTWDGASLWVEENGPRIHRQDPSSGGELWSVFPDQPNYFIASSIASDGYHLWGCSWPWLQVGEIDPVNGHILHLVDLSSPDGIISGAPSGSVWKDGALWLLMSGPPSIIRVDSQTGMISKKIDLGIPGYIYPSGLAWDGNAFWIANAPAALLFKIDPQTGAVIDTVASPGGRPTGLAWDGHYLWVASGGIFKLDLNAQPYEVMRPLRGFWWGFYSAYSDVEWESGLLWLSGKGFTLIDPEAAGQVVRTVAAPEDYGNAGIAFDGAQLWSVNEYSYLVSRVDPLSGAISAQVPYTGHEPGGMAFDGTHLWIADHADTSLYAYPWPDLLPERRLRIQGREPAGVAWDGHALWESDRSTQLLSWLDPDSGAIEEQFRLPMSLPLGISADRAHGTIWALDGGTQSTFELAYPPGPTHILNWNGVVGDSDVTLKWTLTRGSSGSGFSVERRSMSESTYTTVGQATCTQGECEFVDSDPARESINYYRIKVNEQDGSSKHIGPLSVANHFSYGQPKSIATPGQLRAGAHPNPSFGGGLWIWAVGTSGRSVLAHLFDVRGRLLRALNLSESSIGTFGASWDGTDQDGRPVRPGVYFATVENGEGSPTSVRIVILH